MRDELDERFSGAFDSLIQVGIGVLQAIVVILIARVILKFVGERVFRRLESPNLSESSRAAISVAMTGLVGIAAATVILALWGVTWSGIVTAISVGTLGILLGVQDLLRSLIGGIFVIAERPYTIGDRISVRDVTGRVIEIRLRTTVIRSDDGHRVVAPNSIVFTDTMTNYSLRREIRTSLILTGIGGNPAEVKPNIEQAVASVEGVDGGVEVKIRPRKTKLTAPIQDGLKSAPADGKTISRTSEIWVSWLGAGEPEVQAAVLERLLQLYPRAKVRARTVRGTEVPPHGRSGHFGAP
jgi:small-conductance mechanosensitive channel